MTNNCCYYHTDCKNGTEGTGCGASCEGVKDYCYNNPPGMCICKAKNPCDSNPCKNGGTCTNNGETFTCKCTKNWYGDTCEKPLCNGVQCPENASCQSGICKCDACFKEKKSLFYSPASIKKISISSNKLSITYTGGHPKPVPSSDCIPKTCNPSCTTGERCACNSVNGQTKCVKAPEKLYMPWICNTPDSLDGCSWSSVVKLDNIKWLWKKKCCNSVGLAFSNPQDILNNKLPIGWSSKMENGKNIIENLINNGIYPILSIGGAAYSTGDWNKVLSGKGNGSILGNYMAKISIQYGCGWDIDIESTVNYTTSTTSSELKDLITTYRKQCPTNQYILTVETGATPGVYGGTICKFVQGEDMVQHINFLNAMVGGSDCSVASCSVDWFEKNIKLNLTTNTQGCRMPVNKFGIAVWASSDDGVCHGMDNIKDVIKTIKSYNLNSVQFWALGCDTHSNKDCGNLTISSWDTCADNLKIGYDEFMSS